jgi:hypothetical protein
MLRYPFDILSGENATSIFWLQGMRIPSYDNQLLDLAEDLARRMLPAFDTPTGMTTRY